MEQLIDTRGVLFRGIRGVCSFHECTLSCRSIDSQGDILLLSVQ